MTDAGDILQMASVITNRWKSGKVRELPASQGLNHYLSVACTLMSIWDLGHYQVCSR